MDHFKAENNFLLLADSGRNPISQNLLLSVIAIGLLIFASPVFSDIPFPQPADWDDPDFSHPFIDVDEWRETPVHHRYVHGGFNGTDALFSFYFPPTEKYQGRFYQPVPAMPGSENVAQQSLSQANVNVTQESTTIGFAIDSGAYLVESNQGSKDKYPNADRTLTGYRASAAAAQYSRKLAAEMYGPHRPYGYAYGGSGGGYKTISFAESTVGIWDGVVPYVFASDNALPSVLSAQAHAYRVLSGKFDQIIDALDPGGSGNMYEGLDVEQREALLEVTRMGYPPRVWFAHDRLGYGPLSGLIDEMVERDPTYYSHDFWNVPGYLGHNAPESLERARIQANTTVTRVIMSDELERMASSPEMRELGLRVTSAAIGGKVIPAAFELAEIPAGDLKGATLTFASGGAEGQKVSVSRVIGKLVTIDIGRYAFPHMPKIKPGDRVDIDNSIYLAVQTYYRHQVPEGHYAGWEQFKSFDGTPIYPQRKELMGPYFAERAAGSVQSGRIHGKMIAINTLVDEGPPAWQADWYRSKVKEALGDQINDQFRIYYIDNAMHGSPPPGPTSARIVAYTGALQQALRDLSAWVEKGTPPPPNSNYRIVDGQVVIPETAAARAGLQPTVELLVEGRKRTDVRVGEAVTIVGVVEAPPGTGKVVGAEWDFEGDGYYTVKGDILPTDDSGATVTVTTTHKFAKPGTYFISLRAATHRQGDRTTPYARIENLDRVRVVVE